MKFHNPIKKTYSRLSLVLTKTLLCSISLFIVLLVKDFAYIKIGVLWLLLLNVYLVFLNANNRYSFVTSLMILWFNYSIFVANYFSSIESSHFDDAYTFYALQGYRIMLIFCASLVLFTPKFSGKEENIFLFRTSHCSSNQLLAVGYVIVLVLILIFAFERPTEAGERGVPSALYEYSTIFFVLGFYFFGKHSFYKKVFIVLLALFVLQNIVFGGRITALQLLIIVFFIWYDGRKINWIKIFPLAVILLLLFTAIGEVRANFSLETFSVSSTLNTIFKKLGTLDTAYSAYYTSLTFIKAEVFVNKSYRLYMFAMFLLSMVVGGSVPDSNLAQFTLKYYLHYEGGVLPYFGNFYLGIIGIILIAFLVSRYFILMHNLTYNSSGLKKCIGLYVVAAAPRWYLYSPTQLIRGVLLLCMVYFITNVAISSIMSNSKG